MNPLALLPPPLRRPDRAPTAIAGGWLIAFAGSLLLGLLVTRLMPSAEAAAFPVRGWAAVAALVLFAPLVETLIMGGVLEVLRRVLTPSQAAWASAIGWGAAHSAAAPAWGLVVWWPFLIFSALYLVWRARGVAAAMGIAFGVHALHNLLPALRIAFG